MNNFFLLLTMGISSLFEMATKQPTITRNRGAFLDVTGKRR
jgi:hypothetical protein